MEEAKDTNSEHRQKMPPAAATSDACDGTATTHMDDSQPNNVDGSNATNKQRRNARFGLARSTMVDNSSHSAGSGAPGSGESRLNLVLPDSSGRNEEGTPRSAEVYMDDDLAAAKLRLAYPAAKPTTRRCVSADARTVNAMSQSVNESSASNNFVAPSPLQRSQTADNEIQVNMPPSKRAPTLGLSPKRVSSGSDDNEISVEARNMEYVWSPQPSDTMNTSASNPNKAVSLGRPTPSQSGMSLEDLEAKVDASNPYQVPQTQKQTFTPPLSLQDMEAQLLRPQFAQQQQKNAAGSSNEEETDLSIRDLEAKLTRPQFVPQFHEATATTQSESIEELEEVQRQQQLQMSNSGRSHTSIPGESHVNSNQNHQIPPRCGRCDDCAKGLPCLVVNLDSGPGAFSVQNSLHVGVRRSRGSTLTRGVDSRPRMPVYDGDMDHSTYDDNMAIAAVVVESDDEDERQKELREQAARLAEREAQLQAWQEELERQRREIQGGNPYPHSTLLAGPPPVSNVVDAASVVVSVSTSLDEPRPAPSLDRSATAGHVLGPGPLRFAPPDGGSAQAHIMRLDSQMQLSLRQLEQRWQGHQEKLLAKYGPSCKSVFPLTTQWHLRYLWHYARQSRMDGSWQFPVEQVYRAEKKLLRRYVSLHVSGLVQQLQSKTLFPVPGLKTMGGHSCFYMRPSRYFPSQTSTKTIINNLCYVINTMLENSQFAQKEGIGFVACMDDWKMKNFEVNYCYQFMMALQGFMVPVKTQLFLIVNPPSWFGAIWKIMRPMLAPSFRKRVKICPEFKISKYLAPGFEEYLPDDMSSGRANTDAMVADFIAYRQYAEQGLVTQEFSNRQSDRLSSYESSNGEVDEASVGQWSSAECSSSVRPYYPSGGVSLGNSSGRMSHGNDDDDASIDCDINNQEALEEEDVKQPSSSRDTNAPREYGSVAR